MTDAAQVPPAPKSSLWEDMLEIFYAPSRVYARRTGSDWAIPLLILVVLTAILAFATWDLLRPLMEAESARGFAERAREMNLTPEQMEQQRERMEGFAGFLPIIITVMTGILPLIVGLLLWVVGKTVSAAETLGEAMMISVFAYFPRLLGWIALAIQAVIMPEQDLTGMASVSLGPARFLDPATTSAGLIALAARLDLFILWTTVLLGIGLKVKGKVSTAQAVIVAIVLWLLGSIQQIAQFVRG